jgi:hypothetical protein
MRYSVAFMSHSNNKIWVKSYRSLAKAKRAAQGVYKKTMNDPLIIYKNSVAKSYPKKATYKRSKGFAYGSWLRKYQSVTPWKAYRQKMF